VESIRTHEVALSRKLIEGLHSIPGANTYGTADPEQQTASVSFNISGRALSDLGLWLDEEFGVLCRVGLHCSSAAHRTLGTFPDGTVRFGLSAFSTSNEVEGDHDI